MNEKGKIRIDGLTHRQNVVNALVANSYKVWVEFIKPHSWESAQAWIHYEYEKSEAGK